MYKGKIKKCFKFSALSVLDFFTPLMQSTDKQILANDKLDALFMYLFISSLYMFRASQCSSSGGQIVLIHHLV